MDRKAKEGLRHSSSKSTSNSDKEHLPATSEHLSIGIIECSLEGKFLKVNEEFCRIAGYQKEDLLASNIQDLAFEEDYVFDIKLYPQLIAGEIPFYQLEKPLVRKDGRIAWTELTHSLIRDKDGKPLYSLSAVLDISERKRAEEALQLAYERAKELYNVAAVPDVSERERVEEALQLAHEQAERAAERITQLQQITAALTGAANPAKLANAVIQQAVLAAGASAGILVKLMDNRQELRTVATLGYPPAAVITAPIPLSAARPMTDCIRTGQAVWIRSHEEFAVQYPLRAEFRRIFGYEATAAMPLIVGDRVLGGLAFSFIEKREFNQEEREFFLALAQQCAQGFEKALAQEALRQSKERYQNLFDQVPVAVYTCDADGLIQEFNRRVTELWGREPDRNNPNEKYCGSFKLFYLDGRFMPHEECPMARMLKGETLEPDELEFLIERPDGSRRDVIAHPLVVKDEHGEIVEAINCVYDITERKRAEESLQQLNLQLENRVQARTAELQIANQILTDEINERKRTQDALNENSKHLQVLSQRLVEVQEEERRALARELHDSVGQKLTALNINLIIIEEQISEASKQRIGSRLDDSMHLIAEVMSLVRDVMTDLRPAVLDDYGLEAALQSYIAEYNSRYGIKVLFGHADQPIPRLGPSIEMTLLRIAQEALTNVARHAQTNQVTLSLQREENTIRLTIQDNGIGIESLQESTRPGSHGLVIMRERAEAVGGKLRVSSTPESGTEIEASIPFQNGGQNGDQKQNLPLAV